MRKIIFIFVPILVLIVFIYYWQGQREDSDTMEGTKIIEPKENGSVVNQPHYGEGSSEARPKENKASKASAMPNSIVKRAVMEMNRIACHEKDLILKRVMEKKDRASLISSLEDISTNQCANLQKQNTITLLGTKITEQNVQEFLNDFNAVADNARGMTYLKLFRAAIDELAQNNSDEMRRAFFKAYRHHVENSSSLLEVAVSVAIAKDLSEKNISTTTNTADAVRLVERFDTDRNAFMKDRSRVNAEYPTMDLTNIEGEQLVSQLGIEGISKLFLEGMQKEIAIAEKYKNELLEIAK